MVGLDDTVARAYGLIEEGRSDEGIALLRSVVADNPESADAWFELAGILDYLGMEAAAVTPYERAASLRLPRALEPQWAVQYGSTLRNLGRADDAVRVLRDAIDRSPEYPAIDVMLALALRTAGDPDAASLAALRATLKSDPAASLVRNRRALTAYIDEEGVLVPDPEGPS